MISSVINPLGKIPLINSTGISHNSDTSCFIGIHCRAVFGECILSSSVLFTQRFLPQPINMHVKSTGDCRFLVIFSARIWSYFLFHVDSVKGWVPVQDAPQTFRTMEKNPKEQNMVVYARLKGRNTGGSPLREPRDV